MAERPSVTRTTHTLSFEKLGPKDFERLCLWLVRREGYEDAEHFGAKGSDQGRDLVASRDGRRVVFQCKRVERFAPAEAESEIRKVLELPSEKLPHDLVFIVTPTVTAQTRDRAYAAWGDRGSCRFWAGTELDERVKRHPEILKEFFSLRAEEQAETQKAISAGWSELERLDRDAREAVRAEIGLGEGPTVLQLERAKVATALRRRVGEDPCVLVYGESGVGKSALILGQLAKLESDSEKLQVFFLNLRLLPRNIPDLRRAIGCAIEDVLCEMSASLRLLVVDSAEYVAESRPDLLNHLICAAEASNVGVWVISTSEGHAAVRAVVETTLDPIIEHEVPPLTDEDLEEVATAFPQLRRLVTDPRSKELLRRPVVVDLLVRADPSDYPLSEADMLAVVWGKLVRAGGRTERGAPDSREQVFRRLARHQLKPGSASDLYDQLNPTALDGLRRDGLLRPATASPWQVLPEFFHEILRNYAVCQVILSEGDPVTALLELGAPRWALPAARLAAQVLLSAPATVEMPMEGRLERIQSEFDRLAAANCGQRWSDLPTEALLPLTLAGTAFGDAWGQLLGSNAYGLRRIIRIIQQHHRRTGLLSTTLAEPVIELLLDRGWSRNLDNEVERLLRDWLGALIVADIPANYPLRLNLRRHVILSIKKGEERLAELEAKREAELAARTPEQVREDERREREFRRHHALFEYSKRESLVKLPDVLIRDSTVEKLALLGHDLGEEGEDLLRRVAKNAAPFLAPALEEVFADRSIASYRPSLLTEFVQDYYLDDRGNVFGMWEHNYGIRSHRSRDTFGPLAAYYKGPFLAMFQTDFRNGVACLNRLLNHAAKVRVAVLQDKSWSEVQTSDDEVYRTGLSITGESRTYVGDSHVWLWYRATGVGPYPCMSGLQALEIVCDQFINAGIPPGQLGSILLEDCENLAMPALVTGLFVRHLDKIGEDLDPFLIEPAIWRLEFERVMAEHSMLAGSSEGINAPERRKWSLREAAMTLVLSADGERIDSLRELGQRLVTRARETESNGTSWQEYGGEEPPLAEKLAAVEGWAAQLDRDSYEITARKDGILVQSAVPDKVQQVLEPSNEDLSRLNQGMSLVLRYSKDRHTSPGPPKISVTDLQTDLIAARDLVENPPLRAHRPIDAPAAVAAGALQLSFIAGEQLASEDLLWAAQLLSEVAKWFHMNPEHGEFEYSFYSRGADRSAACGLPFLLLPAAAGLRSKLGALGIVVPDLLDGARWLISGAAHESRLLYAQAMDLTWQAPCESLESARNRWWWPRCWRRRGKCHHRHAFGLLEGSARHCVIGDWDVESRRSKVERLKGRLEHALAEVASDKIIVPRLSPAIRALGVAANTTNCCTARAEVLLGALVAAHQRGMAGRKQRYQHSSSDTLVVARALLVGVANQKEELLWASVDHYAGNDELLAELLCALAAAGEENDTAAEAARRVWPNVIEHVLDLIKAWPQPEGYRLLPSQALAALMPNPASEIAYLRREVEGEPINWPELLAWRRQVERWLPVAAGSQGCVDSLVRLLGSISEEEQVTIGLPWVEVLVEGAPDRVASSSWFLSDWLHEVRSHIRESDHLAVWQRIVDMLIVAGDTRVADLSD